MDLSINTKVKDTETRLRSGDPEPKISLVPIYLGGRSTFNQNKRDEKNE